MKSIWPVSVVTIWGRGATRKTQRLVPRWYALRSW